MKGFLGTEESQHTGVRESVSQLRVLVCFKAALSSWVRGLSKHFDFM